MTIRSSLREDAHAFANSATSDLVRNFGVNDVSYRQ